MTHRLLEHLRTNVSVLSRPIRDFINYLKVVIFFQLRLKEKEKDLVETFNKHYINIVEKLSGIKPVTVVIMHNICDNDIAINVITETYKNHPSVKVDN